MTVPLLMDYGGLIEAIAICNPDGAANRALLRAHRNLLSQLPSETAVTILCRAADREALSQWLQRIGATSVRLLPASAPLRSDAIWIQDHLVVRQQGRRRSYLGIVSEHPYDSARWLGHDDGTPVETSRIRLSGGNLLVGRNFRILGAGSIEAEARGWTATRWRGALARYAALDPRPLHLYGYGPDPASPPILQEPFHLDLALALTGCRTERDEPIVLLARPARTMPELDAAAERLRQSGFCVLRNRVPVLSGSIVGYNNVLIENALRPGARRPLVFVPQFGFGEDGAVLALWRVLGFEPRPVPGWAPFIFPGGALRCAAKILKRGAWRGMERVIPDRTLRAIARRAAGPTTNC
ncbi:MAG TPA: hypothetical protein VHA07_01255 [Devosia sp.]|nr:hypothetical protein [Devosia sp.]